MCGRYTLIADLGELAERFQFPVPDLDLRPRYNVSPSQDVLAVVSTSSGEREAAVLHWGLVPFWAKDSKVGYRMINAVGETVADKPAFKNAFRRRRCLVLADGFYEWRKEAGSKVPMRIGVRGWEPFAFAGLWESWTNKETGEVLRSCTIITCPPNELMAPIHNRMPVILPEGAETTWLNPAIEDSAVLKDLLVPFPSDRMEAYPVSTLVNSLRNDTPLVIQPV
ncbi:MAG: SOS response-associated peptidase [Dehalococcoidia bacterium]|nr:SOS response-associated peptidase [Dehalococcoidia bacterium]